MPRNYIDLVLLLEQTETRFKSSEPFQYREDICIYLLGGGISLMPRVHNAQPDYDSLVVSYTDRCVLLWWLTACADQRTLKLQT